MTDGEIMLWARRLSRNAKHKMRIAFSSRFKVVRERLEVDMFWVDLGGES